MDLEELVTGALPGKETVEPAPEEIIARGITLQPGQLADHISLACQEIESDPASAWGPVATIVSYSIASALNRYSSSNSALLLIHAEKTSRGDERSKIWLLRSLKELEDRMRQAERGRRRSAIVGTFSGSLDYLGDIFGEDLLQRITALTGAKRPTARRWIKGGSAQWSNSRQITSFAGNAYSLLEERGMQKEDFLAWLDNPLQGGESPFDLWAKSFWSIPKSLQDELERLGVEAK